MRELQKRRGRSRLKDMLEKSQNYAPNLDLEFKLIVVKEEGLV